MRNAKWWCGAKNNEAPRNFDRASLEMTIRETDVFESPVTSHQSLEITHPCFQNLWCTTSKPEAPRIDMEHHDPANAHSFEAHIGPKERPFAFPSH